MLDGPSAGKARVDPLRDGQAVSSRVRPRRVRDSQARTTGKRGREGRAGGEHVAVERGERVTQRRKRRKGRKRPGPERTWSETRRLYRRSGLPQGCAACGSFEKVELHHRTYARKGREPFSDLVPLCQRHHVLVHKWFRRGGRSLERATDDVIDAVRARENGWRHVAVTNADLDREFDEAWDRHANE